MIVRLVWRAAAMAAAVAVGGCSDPPSDPVGSTSSGAGPTTSDDADATTTTTMTPSTATTSSSEGDSTSTGGPMCPEETELTPPSPTLPNAKDCSLEVVDPAVDPTMALDAGDGEGQIPTVIGAVLLANCGCHYNVTPVMPIDYVDYLSDAQPMDSWDDFHAPFLGTFPSGYEDQPAYVAIERRVSCADPLPMPPLGCRVEGEDGTILQSDLEILAAWLAAGAPDGASYSGR